MAKISENLREAGFIVCCADLKKPKVKKDEDWNNKILSFDDANKALEQGFNVGIVGGVNGFVIFDCDSPMLKEKIYSLMQKTYEEKSITGNSHLIFRADGFTPEHSDNRDFDEGKTHLGELRAYRRYIVCAPSKAKDEKKGIMDVRPYVVLNDVKPVFISRDDIKQIRESLNVSKTILPVNHAHVTDESRSGREFAELCKLIKRGKTKEEIWQHMEMFVKWKEKPESYRELSYQKAIGAVNNNSESNKDYNPIRIKDFLSGKIERENPIIKKFIPEKSLTIVFGEPASCKSLFANYIGSCVASGKKFLDQYKTRKMSVLIISTENPERTDKKRFRAVLKGLRIVAKRRKFENLQMLYCGRNQVTVLNDDNYYSKICSMIEEKNIGLLIFDTISPLIMDANDNLASEIVEIFNTRLFPLIDRFGVSILLTMHSQKSGKDFLGSVKIKASSDCFYGLVRKDSTLSLLCHKNREGEHNLEMGIEFQEKDEVLSQVRFSFIKEFSGKQSVGNGDIKEKKMDSTKATILDLLQEGELPYKEITKQCKERGISSSTTWRALELLYESKEIKKKHGKGGGYYIP